MSSDLTGPSFIAPETRNVERLVIFLHGYGADGNDLISLSQPLAPLLPGTAFYSPNAPFPCEANPMGRQWFSLSAYDPDLLRRAPETMAPVLQEMHEGAARAAPMVQHFIDGLMEQHTITSDKVILAGFSQGTMMALHCAYRRKDALAGVLGYSGALIGADTFAAEKTASPPACLIHGEADPVVPAAATARAHDTLKAAGVEVDKVTIPNLQHGIDQNGLHIGTNFIVKSFGLAQRHT